MKFNVDFGKVNFDDINVYKSLLENNSLKNSSSQNIEEIDYLNYDNVNDINFDIEQGKIEAIKIDEERRKREAEEARIKAEQERKEKEEALDKLYKARDDNNGLFHPNREAQIEADILKLEKELGVSHQPDGWENFCEGAKDVGATAVTFVVSTVEGVASVGEDIVDGVVMLGGGIYSAGASLLGDDEAAKKSQEWTKNFVSKEYVKDATNHFLIDTLNIDESIANGKARSVGNFVGEAGATIALQFVPGGTAVMVGAHTLKGVGSAAEAGFNKNPEASFGQVFVNSAATGALEGAFSYLLYGKTGANEEIKVVNKYSEHLANKFGYSQLNINHPNVVTALGKMTLAGNKEMLKEAVTVSLDGEFDVDKALSDATRAMIVQGFNEVLVNGVIKPKIDNYKQNTIDEKALKVAAAKEDIKVIEKLRVDKAAKMTENKYNLDISGNSGSNAYSSNEISKAIEEAQKVIQQNQLNIAERIVDKVDTSSDGFSYTTKFIKKTIYDEVGKDVQNGIQDVINN